MQIQRKFCLFNLFENCLTRLLFRFLTGSSYIVKYGPAILHTSPHLSLLSGLKTENPTTSVLLWTKTKWKLSKKRCGSSISGTFDAMTRHLYHFS